MAKSVLSVVRSYYPSVSSVSDSRKDITINVTKGDCKLADSKSPNACAMARAFKRQFDGAIISLSVAYLIRGDKAIRFKVPNAVSREIVSFDRNHNFQPGEYKLNAPSPASKLGARRWPQPKDKGRYPAIKRRKHQTAGIRSL